MYLSNFAFSTHERIAISSTQFLCLSLFPPVLLGAMNQLDASHISFDRFYKIRIDFIENYDFSFVFIFKVLSISWGGIAFQKS